MTVEPASWRIDQSKYDRYGEQFNPVERMKILGVLRVLAGILTGWIRGRFRR